MTKRVNKNLHSPRLGCQQVAAYTNQCTFLPDWSCGCSNEIPPFTGTQRISQFITVIIINITDWAMPRRPDKAATQTGGLQYYQAEIWKGKKGAISRLLSEKFEERTSTSWQKSTNSQILASASCLFCCANAIDIVIFVVHSSLPFWKSLMNTDYTLGFVEKASLISLSNPI